jgi:hypothetical protein
MQYPFKKIIIDIKNYLFILDVIKKNKETIEWKKYKLKVDWIGRIYTAVNLPPEILYSPDPPSDIRAAYVIEESRPINEYLTKLGLQEIIIPEIKPIEGTISWGIIYKPFFQKLSLKWIITRLFFVLFCYWLEKKLGIIYFLWEKIIIFYDFIKI